ncbi:MULTISPECIES: TetR/AcrR family transcriptional regulator [Paenibacillus]|uniref:TetR family transcriptional regulator n=1 Tax=Paenibacillus albilobatus TaxID=2716884 RepID=A0A920C8Z0_9BACL|nr:MULTISPECIES: TetR/AcrR family transcriptional regulator [Paenibacillus]GIO30460.1 TetR family transcriptional regulator [Paenibacillus albilobatus]
MSKNEAPSVNRKEEIISAAIATFAEIGYYRATTAQVAERASISQPYIFKFFPTKEALLVAALEASWGRIVQSFKRVVESVPPSELEPALIEAYENILADRANEMLLQMQAQTISSEVVREEMRKGFRTVRLIVLEAFRNAGIPHPEERTLLFLARGMLCNISMALGMPELMEQ